MNKDASRKAAARWLAGLALVLSGCASFDQAISPSKPREPVNRDEILARIQALAARWDAEPVPVGLAPQVFYDDALIAEKSEHMIRRVGRAEKIAVDEPIMKPDHSWEGKGIGGYMNVLTNDAGLFQAWYDCGDIVYQGRRVDSFSAIGYAESTNGVDWVKPRMLPGGHNIVLRPAFGMGIYYDRRETKAAHRYKAVYGTIGLHGSSQFEGLTFAYSRTGKSWSRYEDIEMLDDARADTHSNLFWDEEIELYRVYTRIMTDKGRSSRTFVRPYIGTSSARVVASAFFLPVSAEPWIHVADSPAPDAGQIYAMTVSKYGGIYVGRIGLYSPDGHLYYTLALSRDGASWDFQYADPAHALLEHGEPGAFDAGNTFPPATPPIEVDGEWLLYYSASEVRRSEFGMVASTRPYDRSIGLAKIRKEGFFFLENTGDVASVTTKSFVLEGNGIEINLDAREGSVIADLILVTPGQPDRVWGSSEPVREDGARVRLRWPGQDEGELRNRAVRLRLNCQGAVRLYAMQVITSGP